MIKAKMAIAIACLVLSFAANAMAEEPGETGEAGAEQPQPSMSAATASSEMAQEIVQEIVDMGADALPPSDRTAEGGLALDADGKEENAVSLTLSDSIDLALDTDDRIAGAEAGRKAAKWGLSSARRAKGPTVGWNSRAVKIDGHDYASANQAHNRYGNPHQVTRYSVAGYVMGNPNYPVLTRQTSTVGSYAMHNTFSNSWSLTVPIYSGGQLEGRIDASRYRLNQADLTLENTRQQVRYGAAEAYANLLHRENLERIAGESVAMAEKQLKLINDQYVEGAVAKADVLMMEVRLANYRQTQANAKGAVKIAMSTLAAVVGMPQDTRISPADVFTYEPYPRELAECEEYALSHRPDGIAADYAVKVAEAQKDTAKAGYRPKLNGIIERNMTSNSPFREERSSNWSAGVSLSWSVFDNGVTEADVQQAKATIDQNLATAQYTRRTIRTETRTAYFNMKAAEESLAVAAAAVKKAEESHVIAQARYEEGVDILLTVADAQERLTQARSNYFTALYQYNLYRAALEKAMGVPVSMDALIYAEEEMKGAAADQAAKAAEIKAASEAAASAEVER